jgi:hypothetical protein
VTDCLGSNDDIVLVRTDLSPLGRNRVLRETSKVDKLTLLGDLGKSSSIVLTDGDELTTVIRGPSPGRRTSASSATESGVAQERVEVGLRKSQCL